MPHNYNFRIQKKNEKKGFNSPKERTQAQRQLAKANREALENAVYQRLILHGLPIPTRQFKFLVDRKFAFDFAWIEHKVALEVEGGIYVKGRTGHTSISGIERDIEKYNLASAQRWFVFRMTATMLQDTQFYQLLKRTYKAK